MTLRQFLVATSRVPVLDLRRAMIAAFSVEPARSADAYGRFYCRVIRELGLDSDGDSRECSAPRQASPCRAMAA